MTSAPCALSDYTQHATRPTPRPQTWADRAHSAVLLEQRNRWRYPSDAQYGAWMQNVSDLVREAIKTDK